MSPSPQDSPARPGGGRFDPIAAPWFFPLLVLALLLSFRIFAPSIAERQELAWFDLALSARAKLGFAEPLDPSIRFVELSINDEIARRYATDGEYATVAGILRTLAALDVRVIAVDIIYAHGREEDQNLLAEAIREIHDTTRTTVVLSASKEMQAVPPHLLRSLPRADYQSFVQGIVNVPADRHWREYRLVHEFDGETIPSLALAAYGASRASALAPKVVGDGAMAWKVRTLDGKTADVRADGSRLFLNLQHSYYDDTHDKALENFSGRVFTIEQIEAVARDLAGNSPIRDTIVFLGYDADIDGKATTYGPMQPGMLLHGTALNDLMHGNAIRQAPLHLDVLVHLFVALCAAIAFTKIRSKRMLVVVAVTGACVILLFGWLTIWSSAILLLPAAVSAAELWGISVVLETGRRWGFEQRERTQRDAMLGFYFSPAVLKQVTQNLDMIRPRGGEVAVLLSDLRGFTTLCETQPVERVFELLNRLFAVETDAALRENGSLARFAGDQFLAYWGAPEPCDDAADRALRAALEIHRTLVSRRTHAEADELDAWLNIGIGLHCGRGLVGHVGSRSYRDYNIVGDCVNTTARIESQTKRYAAAILASGQFIEALSEKEKPLSLLVDRVQVKGKSLPTDLHAIFADTDPETGHAMERYRQAFAEYAAGDFAVAASAFAALAGHPHPTVAASAALLATRCHEFAEAPPAEWGGVYELTSK